MKSLLLIRHGEAEHHTKGLTGGWTDVPLTEHGIQQLSNVATRLAPELSAQTVRIIASDLHRASHSANIIADRLSVSITLDTRLREMNNGIAANKTEIEAKQLSLPHTEPRIDWQHYPEGETRRQFYKRVVNCMDDITHKQDTPYIIVAHRGTILNILYWWLRLDIETADRQGISFDISPASITVLRINKWGEHAIERLNDTAHLFKQGMSHPFKFDEK